MTPKQGQPFTGVVEGVKVKGHINLIGTDVYFCQDQISGCDRHTLGHTCSWITSNDPVNFKLYKIKLLSGKCLPYEVELSSLTRFGAKIEGKKVVFGCGAVKFSVTQLKTFTLIMNTMKDNGIVLSELDLLILNKHFNETRTTVQG